MAGNKNLNSAARAKKDKFYTQMNDIAEELDHYMEFFRGKKILCNCDDPFESKFFQYFAQNFNGFALKKLVATSYADYKTAYKIEINDRNVERVEDLQDIKLALRKGIVKTTALEGDEKCCAGDFRSKECIELLKDADVVVTNPPFSLFREYVAQLVEYDKKFIIVGNMNAITYREIFPLIKDNKIWLGYGFNGNPHFKVPKDYEKKSTRFWIDERGQHWRSLGNLHWFTNVETKKRRWDLPLYETYTPEKFPRYDTCDAIEVSKTAHIPRDYFGVMGVPITFLDKYNPNQFEIVGKIDTGKIDEYNIANPIINGKLIYKRIAIRRLRA